MPLLRSDMNDVGRAESDFAYLSDDWNASEAHSRPPSSRHSTSVMPSETGDEKGEGDESDQLEEESVRYESEDVEYPRIFHHIPSDVERQETQIAIYERQSELLGAKMEEKRILERIRAAKQAIRDLQDEIHAENATLSKIRSLERGGLTALLQQLVKMYDVCPFLLGSISCWWRRVVNTTPDLWTAIVFRFNEEKEEETEKNDAKWEKYRHLFTLPKAPPRGVVCSTLTQLECAIQRSGNEKLRFFLENSAKKITKNSVKTAGRVMDLLASSGGSLRIEYLDIDNKSAETLDELGIINARFWSLTELCISGRCAPLAVALTYSSPSPPLNRLIVKSYPYKKEEEMELQRASLLGYLQPFIHTYFSFSTTATDRPAKILESDILTTTLTLASTTKFIILTEIALCNVVVEADKNNTPFELLHLKRLTLDRCDITWSLSAPNLLYFASWSSTLQDVDNKPLHFDSLQTLTWDQKAPLNGEYICPNIKRLNLTPVSWNDRYVSYFQTIAKSSTWLETLQITDLRESQEHVMEFLKNCDTIKRLTLYDSYPTKPLFDALAGCTITRFKKNQGKANPNKMICKSLQFLTIEDAYFESDAIRNGCTRIWLPRAHALRQASPYPLTKISFCVHDDEEWTIY